MSLYLLATAVHGSEDLSSLDINGYEFIEYLLSNSFDGPLTNLIHNFMCNYKCFIQSSYIPFFFTHYSMPNIGPVILGLVRTCSVLFSLPSLSSIFSFLLFGASSSYLVRGTRRLGRGSQSGSKSGK